MEQEYTIGTWMKILYGLSAAVLFIVSIFFFSTPKNPSVSVAVYLIPVFMLAGSILIVINIIRRKIIIYDDRIICIGFFLTKELAISNIKGCRIGQKVIYLEPNSPNDNRLAIGNYDDLSGSEDLVKWIKDNFKDLDAIDLQSEKNRLLDDTTLGFTERDREDKLKKAKQIAIAYNIFGFIGGFVALFMGNTKLITILLLMYPPLGILIMVWSKGLIKFLSNSKKSVYGFTMLGIVLPSAFLLIKSLIVYNITEYSNIWLPALLISAVVCAISYLVGINKSVESIKGQAFVMLIAGLLYGFGSTRQVNCAFDELPPQIIYSTIYSRWIEHNKGVHYHIKINSWDRNSEPNDLEVFKSTYDQYLPGNDIIIYLKKGTLNIPWYYINE